MDGNTKSNHILFKLIINVPFLLRACKEVKAMGTLFLIRRLVGKEINHKNYAM